MSNLLKEYVYLMLSESEASDAHEALVAKSINDKFKKFGIVASRPSGASSLSDVLVTVDNVGESYIEVKMSHSDNLANPRVFFDGNAWATTYKTPIAQYAVQLLNSSNEAKNFINDLSKFVKRKNISLSTTRKGIKSPNVVSLNEMLEFVKLRGNRYVMSEPQINLGELVTQHYTKGKAIPAHYMQAGDDFYLIGETDPLDLSALNKGIPTLAGFGDFKVRISTRSEFYEIQAEIKIKKFIPPNSPFSVMSNSSKINPFNALAEKLGPKKTSTKNTKR